MSKDKSTTKDSRNAPSSVKTATKLFALDPSSYPMSPMASTPFHGDGSSTEDVTRLRRTSHASRQWYKATQSSQRPETSGTKAESACSWSGAAVVTTTQTKTDVSLTRTAE